MAQSSKLPSREIAVCRRIIEVRKLLGLEQEKLATSLGISRERLSSYENLRAPLRYELGNRLCAVLDLNQRWLATGKLPQLRYMNFPGLSESIPARTLFTEAYDSALKDPVERAIAGDAAISNQPVDEENFHLISNNEQAIRRAGLPSGVDPSALLSQSLISQLKRTFDKLPPEKRSEFYRHVGKSINDFLKRHR